MEHAARIVVSGAKLRFAQRECQDILKPKMEIGNRHWMQWFASKHVDDLNVSFNANEGMGKYAQCFECVKGLLCHFECAIK